MRRNVVVGERETSIARGARLRQLEARQRALVDALARGDAERASQARAALAELERLRAIGQPGSGRHGPARTDG